MHYYQFNIKDYSYAAIRMTLLEDLAFRRMLDLHYETEKPLPCEVARIAKLIGMPENQADIREILNEFWLEQDGGWINERALKEITIYKAKADAARANGKKGGRPNKPTNNPQITQSVNLANPEETQPKANHKPLTINQLEETVGKIQPKVIQDAFEHTWVIWSKVKKDLGVKDNSSKKDAKEKSWAKLFNPAYCKKNDIANLRLEVNAIIKEIKKTHQPSEFNSYKNMHFIKFLNQESWRKENV